MTTFEIARKCDEVQKFWGDKMPMLAMEEAGEFIQAISKYEREQNDITRQNLIDEIGDMLITIMALQARYEDGGLSDAINKRIVTKLNKRY